MQKTTAAKLCFTFVIGLGLFGIPLALAQVRTLAMALVALLFYFGFKWRNG